MLLILAFKSFKFFLFLFFIKIAFLEWRKIDRAPFTSHVNRLFYQRDLWTELWRETEAKNYKMKYNFYFNIYLLLKRFLISISCLSLHKTLCNSTFFTSSSSGLPDKISMIRFDELDRLWCFEAQTRNLTSFLTLKPVSRWTSTPHPLIAHPNNFLFFYVFDRA